MNNGKLKALNEQELSEINGGVWWIPPASLALATFGMGYTIGKDLANRK